MNIFLGLEYESYKYVFGILNNFKLPFEENKTISLMCGRNDRAAVQLLVYSEQEMLVNVNEDACFYERGPIEIVRVDVEVPGLERGRVKANLIGLVEDDDRQLKADMIMQQSSIYVEKRRVQPVWVEVEFDQDVAPGVYTPQISVYQHSMFEDERLIRTLTFEVKVMDVELRKPADYEFYLDLWQHNSNIARKYDVELWSDPHFAIMESYISSLADLGQKAITVIVSEIPWSGQSSCYDRIDPANMFEYNIVKVTQLKNHEWIFDFSALNRYVDLCMKYGIKQEIEVFGLLNIWVLEDAGYGGVMKDHGDDVRIRYYEESSRTYKYMKEKQQFELYVAALENNFIEKGWINIVRVLADEPADIAVFTERLNALKAMAPSFQYKAAVGHADFIEQGIEGMVDYVPVIDCMAHDYEQIMKLKQGIKGRLLYYVACMPQYPNTFITSHLLESRLIPWLAWYWNVDGFLRWNYTVWPNDPLNRITYHGPFFPAGDTNFVYPGREGKPMLTLRYKLLQKGIRDFEIIKGYIDQGGDREKLMQKMQKVFLWSDFKEVHPNARRKREELFSLDNQEYDLIIGEILEEMAGE
ncbi:DUF4091 domain-containing protein [Paenibacillus luteus]|uniref:DUF4091 domain-containing protein n=1 Tax=Paenibacillus luteus TaxID=2545753 RepID=UPI001141E2EF|nr:DUF4091 domain-containing protein [Paenibacillus luteus]